MPHRLDIDLDELASVCRRYGIRELFVFGSALRADFSQASDIDLLVEYEPGVRLGFLQYFALKEPCAMAGAVSKNPATATNAYRAIFGKLFLISIMFPPFDWDFATSGSALFSSTVTPRKRSRGAI